MTHTTPATCARGIHDDGTRPLVIGKSQLCGRCHRQFRTAVHELGDLWPALTDSQVRTAAASGTTQRVQSSTRIEAGSLWRPQVTGALAEVREWAQYVIRQIAADPRNHVTTWPADPRVILYALSRDPGPARYLTHVHELAPAFVDEALRLRRRAAGVLDSEYVRRYPLSTEYVCQHEVSDEDGSNERPCHAPLVATIEPADSGRDSAIRCTAHPTEHRVLPHQWAQLQDYVEELRG